MKGRALHSVLGISAFYHDSAAALVQDGKVVAAAQEERFSRQKFDASFPGKAVRYCLDEAQLTLSELDAVVFYEKPLLKLRRLVGTYLAFGFRGRESYVQAFDAWVGGKARHRRLISEALGELDQGELPRNRLLFCEHHFSHAASAYYPSPFRDALVLTADGVGEWATTSVALGTGSTLKMLKQIHFPHSLGLLYAAFTAYTGFKVNSGEYKVMGLAPYGQPRYARAIFDNLLDVKPDGSFRLNLAYFDYCTGFSMTSEAFHSLFGGPPRSPNLPITQRDMDLAASIQVVTETILIRMTRALAAETGSRRLCLAGGVALNCVATSKILRDGRFDDIWIQPAAGDAGGALGAALYAHYISRAGSEVLFDAATDDVEDKEFDAMQGSYLGPSYVQSDVEKRLRALGAVFSVLDDSAVGSAAAQALADGAAVGWFQGRMEFGPRALGNRSILGDPRSPTMQRILNLKIKYRESFRPFAPAVTADAASAWFDLDRPSPYMLLVAQVRGERLVPRPEGYDSLYGIARVNVPRSTIPAVTHLDNSARIQTVDPRTNSRFHELLRRFEALTGCPVLVNTSFNVRGEPIVESPEDAYRCFMGTELDLLVIGNCLLQKAEQPASLRREGHRLAFLPD